MYQIIGQGDPSNILNIIINKLSTNLKCWPDDYNIINQSLLLLQLLPIQPASYYSKFLRWISSYNIIMYEVESLYQRY